MKKRRLCGIIPPALSMLSGMVLCAILLLMIAGQSYLQNYYGNRSLWNNVLLLPFVLLVGSGLMHVAAGIGKYPAQGNGISKLRAGFVLVLGVQFVIARSCWYKMGWDISVVYTTAEELARGVELSNPDYFQLCPNNAPLTILQFIPMWVAVKIGLAVPFVVLPYIDAVLLNLSAYLAVRCVQCLTQNRMAVGFALIVSIGWIALSPYILYPYTDTFAILFPVAALYAYLRIRRTHIKWEVVSLLCFFGASIKPTVLIVLIALVIVSVCRFLAQEKREWKRAAAALAALVIGMVPGKLWQDGTTAYLAGEKTPQGQLSETHYLMLGMNGETYGGHSPADVEFSTSFETLDERRAANLKRAWERVTERSFMQNLHFFAVKAYKAYADGSFASHSSFLELEKPRRTDGLSVFLRNFYHEKGSMMPVCQTVAQGLWLMVLMLCAWASIRLRRRKEIAVLALTLLGLTAYLLLFEVWPRYLFLYAPFFVILASMAFEKPLSFKR